MILQHDTIFGVGMQNKKQELKIEHFELESSTQVDETVEKIHNFVQSGKSLVHIVAYMHNTVLVQTLKRSLQKLPFQVEIVLLKHDDKKHVNVIVFNINTQDDLPLSDAVLQQLYDNNTHQHQTLLQYRTQLFERYFKDNLTNLPNLYQLRRDLQNDDDDYGLILINIDNFQTINSFYGFVVGDYVLEYVGNYLKELLQDYRVYRLSGAEFAVVANNKPGFYELKSFLEELYETIRTIDLEYQNTKIFVNFTLASSAKYDKSNVFAKVSMALIYAKQKNLPFWIYEDRMNFENEYARNLELSNIVRDGVENSRVVPYFQAIVDNKTGAIVRYECLARMIDENEKVIAPDIFIPIAKKIKVYNSVTRQIIDKSFAVFEKVPYDFNINLSIEDIMNSEIFHYIIEKLQNSPVASRVTFELLESEAIKDFKKVDRFINEVIRYGAKIAIDDFGSGYSNFSYVTKMQVDYLKIDGSLIENIDVDEASLIVVETIVDFAKRLGIKTVAEYVHSSVVMQKVKELDIDFSQGFYIDKPTLECCEK